MTVIKRRRHKEKAQRGKGTKAQSSKSLVPLCLCASVPLCLVFHASVPIPFTRSFL
jgi:hypothetical protein